MEYKLALFKKLEEKISTQADKIVGLYASRCGNPPDGDELRNACLIEAWKIIQKKDIVEETADALFFKSFQFVLRRHIRDYTVRSERQTTTEDVEKLPEPVSDESVSDACADVADCLAALDNPKLRAFARAYMDGAQSLAEAGRAAGMKSPSEIKRATAALRTHLQEKLQKNEFSSDHSASSMRNKDEGQRK